MSLECIFATTVTATSRRNPGEGHPTIVCSNSYPDEIIDVRKIGSTGRVNKLATGSERGKTIQAMLCLVNGECNKCPIMMNQHLNETSSSN